MKNLRNGILSIALSSVALLGATLPAAAQDYGQGHGHWNHDYHGERQGGQNWNGPNYNSWQQGWDQNQYDHSHMVIGRVDSFRPYHLFLRVRGAGVKEILLQKGTVIRPTGATPQAGQRVAVEGSFNGNGQFYANRIVLR